MEIQENFVNKVAQSSLISFDLADIYPPGERFIYDLKENLFQGLVVKEKEFRQFVKEHNWRQYTEKHVAIMCSVDAIIPTWTYMLLANNLAFYAKTVFFGSLEAMEERLFYQAIDALDMSKYQDQRIVIKGCGDVPIPISAYVDLVARLTQVAKSIMYGEPCSTVPIYKRK